MTALWLIVLCGALSIVYAIWATVSVMKADAGSPRMQEIAAAVREGAQAYLRRQYATIAVVGVVIFALLAYLLGILVAGGFAIGSILSGAAGFIGMNVSVRANVRTAQAATTSLAGGLELAFKAGAITGMLVAGLALLGVTLYFGFLTFSLHLAPDSRTVVDAMVALGFGASLISAAASSPKVPTSAATSSARSRPESLKTIRATRPPSPITSVTTSAIAQAWRPICSKPMR
jgi:K(+)-stimulated pyrophosphate-energized sodium pump